MLSREAERVYWLARHLERAEDVARLVNVNTLLLLDLPRTLAVGWMPLISITASDGQFTEAYGEPTERNVVRFLVADRNNPGSILSSLVSARENARTVRDIIPREAWEEINDLYFMARDEAASGTTKRGRHAYLTRIIRGSQTMTGLLAGAMTHDHAYHFLKLGRNLERADMTSRIVDVRSQGLLTEQGGTLMPFENIQWMSVLKSLTAYQMYRQKVQGPVRRAEVIRFLVQNEGFPRSVYHGVVEVAGCLRKLPRNKIPLRTVNRLRRAVRNTNPGDLSLENLSRYLDKVQRVIGKLHNDLQETYFALK